MISQLTYSFFFRSSLSILFLVTLLPPAFSYFSFLIPSTFCPQAEISRWLQHMLDHMRSQQLFQGGFFFFFFFVSLIGGCCGDSSTGRSPARSVCLRGDWRSLFFSNATPKLGKREWLRTVSRVTANGSDSTSERFMTRWWLRGVRRKRRSHSGPT